MNFIYLFLTPLVMVSNNDISTIVWIGVIFLFLLVVFYMVGVIIGKSYYLYYGKEALSKYLKQKWYIRFIMLVCGGIVFGVVFIIGFEKGLYSQALK